MTDKNTDKKNLKNLNKFHCDICDYKCCYIKDYKKHLLTAKHKRLTNTDETSQKKSTAEFVCECGKEYKHRQSLHSHQKKCTHINYEIEEEEIVEEKKKEEPDYNTSNDTDARTTANTYANNTKKR